MCWLTAPRIVIDLVLRVQQIKLSRESFCCNTTWDLSPQLLLDNIPASLAVRRHLPEFQVFYFFFSHFSTPPAEGWVRGCVVWWELATAIVCHHLKWVKLLEFPSPAARPLTTRRLLIRPLCNAPFKAQFCEKHTLLYSCHSSHFSQDLIN